MRRLLVREVELANQAIDALRLLERIQVLALDVLDQCHGQRGRVVDWLDQHRYQVEPSKLRGTEAPFARDDLVLTGIDRPHEDRLHDALYFDRFGEFGQCLRIHLCARLILAGL